MPIRFIQKFYLLMWKHFTISRRNCVKRMCELSLTPTFCFILIFLRTERKTIEPEEFKPFYPSPKSPIVWGCAFQDREVVAYSPSNPLLRRVINTTCPNAKIVEFQSREALNNELSDQDFAKTVAFAVSFNDELKSVFSSKDLVQHLDVHLRMPTIVKTGDNWSLAFDWSTNLLLPKVMLPPPRIKSTYGETPRYYLSGFLNLQTELSLNFISTILGQGLNLKLILKMQRMPYPEFVMDSYYSTIGPVIYMVIMLCYLPRSIFLLHEITLEKEKLLKVSMKVMGVSGFLYWTSLFIYNIILYLVHITVMMCLLTLTIKNHPVFVSSNPWVLFVFFVVGACCATAFCFLISTFFSKANQAATVGAIFFLFSRILFILAYKMTKLSVIVPTCLLFGSAMSFGTKAIVDFENKGEGVHWDNFYYTPRADNELTLAVIFIMLVADIFLYLILTYYMDSINPGKLGIAKPWYFLCTRTYWLGPKKVSEYRRSDMSAKPHIEEPIEILPIGIELDQVSKRSGTQLVIKKFSLVMYEGHITALFGHDKSGKSTVLHMITGLEAPTRGFIKIYGNNVVSEANQLKGKIGLCLQENVLFDELTIWEHMYLVGRLKGLRQPHLNAEIEKHLKLMEMIDKKGVRSKKLSEGMKRKLSVAMAFCGKSKVILLDEPTASMDPNSQRAIWTFLQKQKQKRCILLTTPYMNEADLVADRIAVLLRGELQCCGSPFFLKKKFGSDYQLVMDIGTKCRPQRVTKLLKNYVPEVTFVRILGTQLYYKLPQNASNNFEKMLDDLDSKLEDLRINNYRISPISLDEVFLRFGGDSKNQVVAKPHAIQLKVDLPIPESIPTGPSPTRMQFRAMFFKKMIYLRRSWLLFLITQIMIPIAFIWLSLPRLGEEERGTSREPRKITLNDYKTPITVLHGDGNTVYYKLYENMVRKYGLLRVKNIPQEIIQVGALCRSVVKKHYIVGASIFANTSTLESGHSITNLYVTGWFNGEAYHSTPLTLQLLLNVIFKNYLGENFSIEFTNHPIPVNLEPPIFRRMIFMMVGDSIVALSRAGIYIIGVYILFYIRESAQKVKQLQFLAGMNSFIFWSVYFICDLCTFLVTVVCIIVTVYFGGVLSFQTAAQLGWLAVMYIIFALYVLPLMYVMSCFIQISGLGLALILFFGAITGIYTWNIVLFFEEYEDVAASKYVDSTFLASPFYILGRSMYLLRANDLCLQYNFPQLKALIWKHCADFDHFFSLNKPYIGAGITISLVMGVFLSILVVAKDFGFFRWFRKFYPTTPPKKVTYLDSDVLDENARMRNKSYSIFKTDVLVLCDLTKYHKTVPMVNGICLGVKPSECFGLLGPNGAGKSIILKMIIGEEHMSFGDVWIDGLNIKTHRLKVQKLIGYCPQSNALLEEFTPRETLNIFGLIRGLSKKERREAIAEYSKEFNFADHLDKKIKNLSVATQRKLSIALAFIGDPLITLLDEPTTGLDPEAKRCVWNALAKLRDSGNTIVLTSYDIEECEILCTRLAILVNGSFQFLGSIQKLKDNFVQSYILKIKLQRVEDLSGAVATLDKFIFDKLEGAKLKERYLDVSSYQVLGTMIPCSKMFGLLERHKKKLLIEYYTLGHVCLDEVIWHLTRTQR